MKIRKGFKFGGTSTAVPNNWRTIKQLVDQEPGDVVVFLSAMGKRHKDDTKITTLLQRISHKRSHGNYWDDVFQEFSERHLEMAQEFGLNVHSLQDELDRIKNLIETGCSNDVILSSGEKLCAQLFAEFGGYTYVDPYDHIVYVLDDGSPNLKAQSRSCDGRVIIMAGFFGRGLDGDIKVFKKGGTDTTLGYVTDQWDLEPTRWSDTAMLTADPGIVPGAQVVKLATWDEFIHVVDITPNVFHPDGARLCVNAARNTGANIYIKNTMDPYGSFTTVQEMRDLVKNPVIGVYLRDDYTMFKLDQEGIKDGVGYLHAFAGIFRDMEIPVQVGPGGSPSIPLLVRNCFLDDAIKLRIKQAVEGHHMLSNPKLTIKSVSAIFVVGDGMVGRAGFVHRITGALKDIPASALASPEGEGIVEVMVDSHDAHTAVRALHKEFFE